jgi:hypothetical protein
MEEEITTGQFEKLSKKEKYFYAPIYKKYNGKKRKSYCKVGILDVVLRDGKKDGSLKIWKEEVKVKEEKIKRQKQRILERKPIKATVKKFGSEILDFSLYRLVKEKGHSLERVAKSWKTTPKEIERRVKKYEEQEVLS